MRAPLLVALLVAAALAGCTGDDSTPTTTVETDDGEEKQLTIGKGGILGLVIDDRFRPIGGALVLIQPVGLTAETNDNGEFEVADLDPGAYSLRVSADGHEAAPATVQVREGEFAEASLLARRTINQEGTIITEEYSVMSPCAASAGIITASPDCTGDLSDDTNRLGFFTNYTSYENVTWMVVEFKANKPASPESGAYKVVIRNGSDTGQYYANDFTDNSDYMRFQLRLGERSTQDLEARNHIWNNTSELQIALFAQGQFKGEGQSAIDAYCSAGGDAAPLCPVDWRGTGAQAGVRGQFIVSVFIDEPTVPIDSYCVLC